jgi:uncharacterized membrane protein
VGRFQPDSFTQYLDAVLAGDGRLLGPPGHIRQHRIWMVLLYILALLVTGLFTLWPGRVMHGVLFGV